MSFAPVIVLALCCLLGWLKWRSTDQPTRAAFVSIISTLGIIIVIIVGGFSALAVFSQIYESLK